MVPHSAEYPCAHHVHIPDEFDDNDFNCDWACNKGFYHSAFSRDALKCFLPIAPSLNVVGSGTETEAATDDANALFTDDGAECFDDPLHCNSTESCDISDKVEVSGDIVDLSKIGTYIIQYKCTNLAVTKNGNTVCTSTNDQHFGIDCYGLNKNISSVRPRMVIVADQVAPTCTWSKSSSPEEVTIEASFPYDPSDLKPTCKDNCGFDNTTLDCAKAETADYTKVKATNVDVESIGTYLVTYSASDAQGNVSPDYVRTVKVIDSLKPIIGLNFGDGKLANDPYDSGGPGLGGMGISGRGHRAHPAYGVKMEKSGYADKEGMYLHENPAIHHFSFSNAGLMMEVASANVPTVAAVACALGVALVAVAGRRSRSASIAELV
jgi:hypothetical protein